MRALIMTLLLGLAAAAQADAPAAGSGAAESLRYFDGRQWRPLWQSEHEIAEIAPANQAPAASLGAGARLVQQRGGLRIWRLQDTPGAGVGRSLAGGDPARFSPVFYLSPHGGARLVPRGNIVVRFFSAREPVELDAWAEAQGLRLIGKTSLPATYLFAADTGMAAVHKANDIQHSGKVHFAVPQWWREAYTR